MVKKLLSRILMMLNLSLCQRPLSYIRTCTDRHDTYINIAGFLQGIVVSMFLAEGYVYREKTCANLPAAKVTNAREDAQSSAPLAMYYTKSTDLVSTPPTLAVWEGEADGSRNFSNAKAGEGI